MAKAKTKEEKICKYCQICVRACEKVTGYKLIEVVSKGEPKKFGPAANHREFCIGCGACAAVCPTEYIEIVDRDGKRYIEVFNIDFDLALCKECGKPITTTKHIEHLKKKINLPDYIFELCDECKRKFYMERIAVLGHM